MHVRPVCSLHHRAASTTQKALAVTSVAQDTLATRAEVGPMTASPAPARTMRSHGGKVTDRSTVWGGGAGGCLFIDSTILIYHQFVQLC